MDSSSLSGLKYQESYFLFLLIAEYRVGQEFGKEEGIKDFAKRLRIPHGYVNSLLTRLVEAGLVERQEGYSEGRGKASYRYKLTDRLLDEVARSKCLFDGIVSPCDFKFVYRVYKNIYSKTFSEARTLERWVMLNLIALSNVNVWEDSHDFTKLNSVIESGLKSYRIASAISKLLALKVIYKFNTENTILGIGKTIFYINGGGDWLVETLEKSKKIKCVIEVGFQSYFGIPRIENTHFFFHCPYMGVNVQKNKYSLESHALSQWIHYGELTCNNIRTNFISSVMDKCQPSEITSSVVARIRTNSIASLILSEHSELLRQSDDLFEVEEKDGEKLKLMAKGVYEALLSDPKIRSEIALNTLFPETVARELGICSIDEIVFDWHSMKKEKQLEMPVPVNFTRALILFFLYHSFCLARMYFQLLEEVESYKPTELIYHIGLHIKRKRETLSLLACIHAENRSKGAQYKDELHAFALGRDACCYHHKKVLPN